VAVVGGVVIVIATAARRGRSGDLAGVSVAVAGGAGAGRHGSRRKVIGNCVGRPGWRTGAPTEPRNSR
jgi:hypothetical protein